jgi:hypothetical protein
MFFGVQILGKKRPLSNAWLLGCGRKIGKKKIMKENIAKTCEMIISPAVPLALRLSAVLMSGVIMIFHQKQQYILDECHGAVRSSRHKANKDGRTTSASTVRLNRSELLGATSRSHGARSTARREDTVTFREETENNVSKHVEEIYLQEFLSTQPASDEFRLSIDKKSLEFSSGGSKGGINKPNNSLNANEDNSNSFSYNPSISGGNGMASSLDCNQAIEIEMAEETFQPENSEGVMPENYNDDLMRDFFFTDTGAGGLRDEVQQLREQGQTDPQQLQQNQPHEFEVLASDQDNSHTDANANNDNASPSQEEKLAKLVKRQYRKRKEQQVHFEKDESDDITLPRDTIRDWLRNPSDIICSGPLFERTKKPKRAKLDFLTCNTAILRHACPDLLHLFSDGGGGGGGENNVVRTLVGQGEGAENSEEGLAIEMERLRQQDGPSLSPQRVSDVIFHSSSSEELEGVHVQNLQAGQQQDNDNEDNFFQSDAVAPFLPMASPEFYLPPTDEFMLPETNEQMTQQQSQLQRQYQNISFTPLRLPSQSQSPLDQSQSPYYHSSEASRRVLSFLSDQETQSSPIRFVELMKNHSIKRCDVARIFFHSLVLHSRASVKIFHSSSENGREELLINVTA